MLTPFTRELISNLFILSLETLNSFTKFVNNENFLSTNFSFNNLLFSFNFKLETVYPAVNESARVSPSITLESFNVA